MQKQLQILLFFFFLLWIDFGIPHHCLQNADFKE